MLIEEDTGLDAGQLEMLMKDRGKWKDFTTLVDDISKLC